LLQTTRFALKESRDDAAANPKGLWIATILFCVFAFPILAFDENLLSVNRQTLIFGGLVLAFIIAGSVFIKKIFKRPCPVITNIMFFLAATGFIMLQRLNPDLAARQLGFAALGLAASLFVPLVFRIFREFEKLEKLFAVVCFVLIGMTSIAELLGNFTAIPIDILESFGAARWVTIGGVSFQPSEFAKPIFVIYLAAAFRVKPSMKKLIFTGIFCAVLIGLLVLQRDLGGALKFFTVFMVIFYTATGNKPLFVAGFGAMAVASVAAYQIFPHLRVRVLAWSNPWPYISGEGFQITQSLFAIATWGFFGSGLGRGLPGRIPAVERDVIFSAISEEFGWIFGLLFIGVYAILLIRGADIARRAKRPLHALMALGFTTFLAFQAFVSIGGNIKLIPMTGVTLPFVSYGGSSIFVSFLAVGIINWLNGQLQLAEEKT